MITVTGLKEIDQVLKALPRELSHEVLGKAYLDAAKPLVEKEKELAPVGNTGNLVKSIGAVRSSIKKATAVGQIFVGPRRKGQYKGFAGHLVEFGTKKRATKKGANRGIMPKEPFAKPAFDATIRTVEFNVANSIGKVMIRTMKRYIKKTS